MEDLQEGIGAVHKASILGLCGAHYSAGEVPQWAWLRTPNRIAKA